jgi:glycosyltransferase involved in cell wall biosynthesis
MDPLVSVVVPTYNHAHFLHKAIQSVIDQTYTNWEMLIVDNHSNDDTDTVVGGFNDLRIKLLKIHNNGVIAASRNKGIQEAKGDWIAFLDSDDNWYPKKLETVMGAIKQEDVYDVFSTDELMVDSKTGSNSVLHYGPYEENFYRVLLMGGNRLSPSATLIRHSFLKEHNLLFNEAHEYIAVEDYDLWLNLAKKGAKFKFINSIQGEYLIHPGNISAQLLRQRKNYENLLHEHVFCIQKFHPMPEELWKQLAPKLCIGEIKQLWSDGHIWKACKTTMNTFFTYPLDTTSYLYGKVINRLKKNN